jgi:hypothetical protein
VGRDQEHDVTIRVTANPWSSVVESCRGSCYLYKPGLLAACFCFRFCPSPSATGEALDRAKGDVVIKPHRGMDPGLHK